MKSKETKPFNPSEIPQDKSKRKVLFIDRDGTIIKETVDEQIDGFEKMIFYPKAFTFLGKIAKELDFELVM
ncbi:MAG TPA: hypothetical protein ENH60_00915, partial [Pricia sp.]|nr:hypothetical protein [Pricia sp.]